MSLSKHSYLDRKECYCNEQLKKILNKCIFPQQKETKDPRPIYTQLPSIEYDYNERIPKEGGKCSCYQHESKEPIPIYTQLPSIEYDYNERIPKGGKSCSCYQHESKETETIYFQLPSKNCTCHQHNYRVLQENGPTKYVARHYSDCPKVEYDYNERPPKKREIKSSNKHNHEQLQNKLKTPTQGVECDMFHCRIHKKRSSKPLSKHEQVVHQNFPNETNEKSTQTEAKCQNCCFKCKKFPLQCHAHYMSPSFEEDGCRCYLNPPKMKTYCSQMHQFGCDIVGMYLSDNQHDKELKVRESEWFQNCVKFRKENYFDCHALPPGYKEDKDLSNLSKPAQPSTHKCEHLFILNERLFAEPLFKDDVGRSCCAKCWLPALSSTNKSVTLKSKYPKDLSNLHFKGPIKVNFEGSSKIPTSHYLRSSRPVAGLPNNGSVRPASLALRFQKGIK